jgi:hypothetical protein
MWVLINGTMAATWANTKKPSSTGPRHRSRVSENTRDRTIRFLYQTTREGQSLCVTKNGAKCREAVPFGWSRR